MKRKCLKLFKFEFSFISFNYFLIVISLLIIHKLVSAQDKNELNNLENIGHYFIDAVNNPDEIYLRSLIQQIFTLKDSTHSTIQSYCDKLKEISDGSGGLILNSIKISYNGIHIIVQQKKNGRWKDYQLIRNHTDNKVKGIFIADITEPIEIPKTEITDSSTLGWLTRYIKKLSVKNDFSGSVLLPRIIRNFIRIILEKPTGKTKFLLID